MNDKDIQSNNLKAGDVVDIFNYHDNIERVARKFIVVAYNIPVGCCATYFPETNVLVPINSVADKSNTPTSKSVVVNIRLADQVQLLVVSAKRKRTCSQFLFNRDIISLQELLCSFLIPD